MQAAKARARIERDGRKAVALDQVDDDVGLPAAVVRAGARVPRLRGCGFLHRLPFRSFMLHCHAREGGHPVITNADFLSERWWLLGRPLSRTMTAAGHRLVSLDRKSTRL